MTQFYSEWQQDVLLDKLLKGKRGGTFVDIGSNHYRHNNNSYYFEVEKGYTGIAVELDPQYAEEWEKNRITPLVCADASTMDYKKLFTSVNMPQIIDFISIDIDPSPVTLAALVEVMASGYQFNVIDFELDNNPHVLKKSTELLTSMKYKLVKEIYIHQGSWHLDDLWVHESFYDESMVNL